MNLQQKNYFSNLTPFSFFEMHRNILKEMRKITNPRLTHAIENYRFAIEDLQEVLKTPVWVSTTYGNKRRREAYKALQKMLRGLVKMYPGNQLVAQLYSAFTRPISDRSNAEADSIIANAAQAVSAFKPEDLKEFALDTWVDLFLKANSDYLKTREAKKFNVKAQNSATVKLFRRYCSAAFRCANDMITIRAANGDEGCQEFLDWFKGI